MSTNPLVPIEITGEENADSNIVDVPNKRVSSTDINDSTSEASSPPPTVRRIVSDRLKNQVRNSRTASLIIPVVNTDSMENDDNNQIDDIVDFDTTLNDGTSLSDNDESFIGHRSSNLPPLPSRPPKTPPRKPLNLETREYDPVDQYGMEREKAAQFSPVTVKSHMHEISNDQYDNHDDAISQKSTFEEKRQKFLIHSRKYQVDYILDLFTSAHLTIEDNIFFEKLHSSDVFIATISQIRSGDYASANQSVLFTLLLKSLKVSEHVFSSNNGEMENGLIDEMIDGLSFLINSPEDKKLKFRNDLLSVYSLFNAINEVKFQEDGNDERIVPNPLVAAFLYRCSSKFVLPQTLILALIINEYVTSVNDESREFRFLLLRSIETIQPELLLNRIDTFTNPLVYVNSLLDSSDFWLNFVQILYEKEKKDKRHQFSINNVLTNLVIYGAYYLIDVIVNLRHELGIFGVEQKPGNFANTTPDLVRFNREFMILNESGESQFTNLTLDKLYSKNEELQRILQEKTDAYNVLLNNYKQLNEEKMSVEDTISKYTDENLKLQATFTRLSAQVDQLLGQFDVIQQTVEKNERVKKLNETMKLEIERLKQENIKLLAK
ncbi:hypothetical protein CANINC_001146 [Pichia inconspicua]|uniref:Uncharacterized protein n=1 Tax=Pichia inconspicua TaxID=52247 RepID=A0A4T0X4A9_9ASCO|nr:hypothetical protein CANINC_001146 [[Candida] inconspicua]